MLTQTLYFGCWMLNARSLVFELLASSEALGRFFSLLFSKETRDSSLKSRVTSHIAPHTRIHIICIQSNPIQSDPKDPQSKCLYLSKFYIECRLYIVHGFTYECMDVNGEWKRIKRKPKPIGGTSIDKMATCNSNATRFSSF